MYTKELPGALSQPDILLNEKQFCELVGISPALAARMRYRGDGPKFIAISFRRIGYRRSAIERWLDKRERQSGVVDAPSSAGRSATFNSGR